MFIDIHAHAFKNHPKNLDPIPNFCNPRELIDFFDRYDIEKGCVLPIVSPEIYLPQSNEDVLEMAQMYPDRIIPFCNVDPRCLTNSPDAKLETVLMYYKNCGCKGLGEVMPNMPLFDAKVQNLFRAAELVGLPLTFDGSDQLTNDFGLYDDPGLPQLEHTLQRFPKLKIFGHGPIFWSELARLETPGERGVIFGMDGMQIPILPSGPIREEGVVPKLMRKYPNLYGDLSDGTPANAFRRDMDNAARFINEFQDRLCYGTDVVAPDMPTSTHTLLFELLNAGKISQSVFNKVARENAIRILEL